MNIARKVKTALDETRMLILGAQILIGFQFSSVFQNLFDQLPDWSRYLDGVALLLLILTVALLILPGPWHRIVEEGNATGRFHRLTGWVASLALAPFAAGIGIDVAIVAERLLGTPGGIAAGTVFGALAVVFWYGLAGWRARSTGQVKRGMSRAMANEAERPVLHEQIDQMLTEARVILPGAQALLGFQLAIALTETFARMPAAVRLIHGAALGCVALSIILLMAPAAYHRIVYGGEDDASFYRTGSWFVTCSTVPLAVGMAADVAVVGTKIVSSPTAAAIAGVAVLVVVIGFWHAFPLLARRLTR
jgi:Family of unknown function (DUF6328)